MECELTQHARDALARRQIPLEWVDRALTAPEWTEADRADPELEHRLVSIPEFGGRVLRVVLNVAVTPRRVVTAFFDRGRSGR